MKKFQISINLDQVAIIEAHYYSLTPEGFLVLWGRNKSAETVATFKDWQYVIEVVNNLE